VIISRACKTGKWIVLAGIITACGSGQSTASTPGKLPTFAGAIISPTSMRVEGASTSLPATRNATNAPDVDRTWTERPFGAGKLVVAFYTDPGGSRCLRTMLRDVPGATSPQAVCATTKRSTLLALQSVEADSTGAVYSIIAGRALSDQITAVSIEFTDGDNTPAEVDDGGFLVMLPGKRTALRAIPIDQYGNLVGDKFTFNR
jgi:hypothetical protein